MSVNRTPVENWEKGQAEELFRSLPLGWQIAIMSAVVLVGVFALAVISFVVAQVWGVVRDEELIEFPPPPAKAPRDPLLHVDAATGERRARVHRLQSPPSTPKGRTS